MFKRIKNAPPHVIAFNAVGRINDQDYKKVLIPAIEYELDHEKYARVLMRFGPEFAGYTAQAIIDDTVFGLQHTKNFERLAVVTNVPWIRHAVALFRPLMSGRTRVFPLDEETEALRWIGTTGRVQTQVEGMVA